MQFDSFGAPTSFNYGNGNATHQSGVGACVYLSIMLFTLVFTIQQIIVLYQRGATTFTTSELKDHQEDGYSFGPEDGFRAAFTILDNATPDFVHRDGLLKMEVKQVVFEFHEDGTIL